MPDRRPSLRAALAGGRLATGVVALTLPSVVERAVGVSPGANPDGRYLVRLFGSREVFVGAVALGALGPRTSRRAACLGAGVDALDAVALVRAGREGRMAGPRARRLAVGCTAVAVLGTLAGSG